jgi:hypothetical protein
MTITKEIQRKIELLGGSGSTNSTYYSASKSLNYAQGVNINNAPVDLVTAVPYTFKYEDSVGLFGSENAFIKIQLNILGEGSIYANLDVQENNFTPVWVTREFGTLNDYDTGLISFGEDTTADSDYVSSEAQDQLSGIPNLYIRIDLRNVKTGNKYIDNWFDVRVYTKNKEEYFSDTLFIKPTDYFYIGLHARNTRRLPYNVEVDVGKFYISYDKMTESQRRLTPV